MTVKIGRRKTYPWEEWFSTPSTVIVKGLDYKCSQSTMCQMIRNAASQRRISVTPEDHGVSIHIKVGQRTEE